MASTQAKERSSPCQRRRIRPRCYTIDALTDGSEWTGEGTLFVSVYKEAPYANESLLETAPAADDCKNDDSRSFQAPPVARYAFGSLSDLTSRLAFDQRFSLALTKAFFQLTCHEKGPRCRGLEGLPALLLNLQQAGAETLTLVLDSQDGPTDNHSTLQSVQDTIELILPSHRTQHPQVQLCCVPQSPSSKSDQNCWWMVYRDDYILVHAKRIHHGKLSLNAASSTQSTVDSVVYLVTLLCHERPCASLIVVSGCIDPSNLDDAVRQLPVVSDHHASPEEAAIVAWGLSIGAPKPMPTPLATTRDMTWYYTMPRPEGTLDPGLLVRAQQQSKAWHAGKPQWFPWNVSEQDDSDMSVANQQSTEKGTRIRTGWSVVLNPPGETFKLVDRMRHIKQHVHGAASSDRFSWVMQINFGLSLITDENEIELDDEEEQSDMAGTDVPSHNEGAATSLLVLGTGCAAPSPYRGSSGYALFLRDNLTLVFEVGDGFLTQWSRYSSRSLLSIRVIWISHAHWDHYGGLAALLLKLAEMRRQQMQEVGSSDTPSSRKRPRLESHGRLDVPLVLASGKVLKYLDCFFGDTSNYFHGVDIGRQARHASELVCRLRANASGLATTFPVAFFDIVRVDHSCADSFGFVLGLNQRQQQNPFVFCFSGDTRPCQRFANTCKLCGEQWSLGVVDVLLHEATFDQAEAEMSNRKKHSTVKEAIDIGLSIRARKIYLTHFSQRYNSPPDHDGISNGKWTPMFDGVLVPLFGK